MTDKEQAYVNLNDLGESGLGILLYFHLRVPDYATELLERGAILSEILKLAAAIGVQFAYPTRTLHIDELAERLEPSERAESARAGSRP